MNNLVAQEDLEREIEERERERKRERGTQQQQQQLIDVKITHVIVSNKKKNGE